MRAVIQRVLSATASVNGEVVSSIEKGLCILVGISRGDTEKDIDYLVKKILSVRFFEDDNEKRWNKSVVERDYEILCLSQITLYHKLKGNKLDFHNAMPPETSKDYYHRFLHELKNQYKPERVKEGIFGEYIVVGIQNDGPVTVVLDSPNSIEEDGTCDNTNEKAGSEETKPTRQEKKLKNRRAPPPPATTSQVIL